MKKVRTCGEIIPDETNSHLNIVVKQPLRVAVGFLAWNFPLLNLGYKLRPILRQAAPAFQGM